MYRRRNRWVEFGKVTLFLILLLIGGCAYNRSSLDICADNYQECLGECEYRTTGVLEQCRDRCFQQYLNCQGTVALPIPPQKGF
ncbi:MAG: hypothetical protein ABGW77_03245 [Campylobacterales bacterium]|jgi:hypothetical protein